MHTEEHGKKQRCDENDVLKKQLPTSTGITLASRGCRYGESGRV
jgi:hypothetical protein